MIYILILFLGMHFDLYTDTSLGMHFDLYTDINGVLIVHLFTNFLEYITSNFFRNHLLYIVEREIIWPLKRLPTMKTLLLYVNGT